MSIADWSSTAAGPLTREDLLRGFEVIRRRSMEPDPCALGRHVVSPRALYRPGIYICASCRAPVDILMPLSEVQGV